MQTEAPPPPLTYHPGSFVSIILSQHSGIEKGDIGEVVESLPLGLIIRFTKRWRSAFVNEKDQNETRDLWFTYDEIRPINS